MRRITLLLLALLIAPAARAESSFSRWVRGPESASTTPFTTSAPGMIPTTSIGSSYGTTSVSSSPACTPTTGVDVADLCAILSSKPVVQVLGKGVLRAGGEVVALYRVQGSEIDATYHLEIAVKDELLGHHRYVLYDVHLKYSRERHQPRVTRIEMVRATS